MKHSSWSGWALIVAAAFVFSCSGSGSNEDAGTDAGSACGHPGDMGNSLGVGKYCQYRSDCPGALLCSSLNNSPTNPLNTYFCTLVCDPCSSPPTDCGAGATCVCQGP